MYFVVDTKKCGELGLTGANALVYSALCMLAKKAPWKGSLSELARISMCGSKNTAERALVQLTEKGLINKTAEGWSIVKNQTNNVPEACQNDTNKTQAACQNDTKTCQNDTKLKDEKERTKEKEEKENKVEPSKNRNACTREKFFETNNFFETNKVLTPEEMEKMEERKNAYQLIVGEYGHLHPGTIYDDFTIYYNGHGWPERGNRVDLLRRWVSRVRKPAALGETERKCLGHLLQNIPPAIACRFYDVLRGFEINDTNVVFYFGAEHLQKVADWIGSTEIPDIIEQVYHRGTMASRGE